MKLEFEQYEVREVLTYFEVMRNGWRYRIEYYDDCDEDEDDYYDICDCEIEAPEDELVATMCYTKILNEKNIWGQYKEPYSMLLSRKVVALINRLYKEYGYDVTDKEINAYLNRLEAADVCE